MKSKLTVNWVILAHINALKVSEVDQKEAPSSNVNRMPPMGALNAAEIPAAAPHVTKSLFVKSFLNPWNLFQLVSNPNERVHPCDTTAPIIDPA